MEPRVSVIVPAYNMAEYTVETIESLRAQTYPDVEIIVVDDGSTDGTAMALERFGDSIIRLRQENRGACAARNRGFRASTGELVAFLDCDDLYHPEKVERFVAWFRDHPGVGMVYSPEYLIDENGEIVGENRPRRPHSGEVFSRLLRRNFVGSSTPIVRREALDEVGLWDEAIFTTADWDLWLRIARRCLVGYIDDPLSYSRQVSLYNRRHIERTDAEASHVLEKLRRAGVDGRDLRRARSHVDLLLHRYAFCNGDHRKALRYLFDALRRRPFQVKGYLLLPFTVLSRPVYRFLLGWKASRAARRRRQSAATERSVP
jgi:glycosyltransferase involved in cell wall biosynthesis